MQYTLDRQFGAHRHAHARDLVEQEVLPFPSKNFPEELQGAVAQRRQEYLTYVCQWCEPLPYTVSR